MRPSSSILSRARWGVLALAASLVGMLFMLSSGAQAAVVNDSGTWAGIAVAPGSSVPAGMAVTASGTCSDPQLSYTPDLFFSNGSTPLCWRGGPVMHANETFALTWDPNRKYWAGTRGYVEQFLRDVADGSGSSSSPYSVTSQYTDTTSLAAGSSFLVAGRAANNSKYGGGCVDFGSAGGSQCQIGTGTTAGHDYPNGGMGDCPAVAGNPCLTDADIQSEVSNIASATSLASRTAPGYTPTLVVLTPPATVVCLDSSGTVCSANSSATAQFCSYHSQVNGIAYVVQPWTTYTSCDEPKLPKLPDNPTPQQLTTDAGLRLVSPLSESHIAAIVNPGLNGWVANNGGEIDDIGGCAPGGGPTTDTVGVGGASYVLVREYNNADAIESDPNTYFGCAPDAFLSPAFVVPSAVNAGDVVEFDGSSTGSTLIVPQAGYAWDFGDGTGATGPSVVHSFGKGGNFTVKLTVTDRGGNVQTLVHTVSVLGANGLPVPPSNPPTTNPSNVGSSSGLQVRIQLLPQGLRSVLRSGISLRVSANEPANGIATVSISRATAKRLHVKLGRGRDVVIGRGTLSAIKQGTVVLHLHLGHAMVAKLKHLKHTTLTVRLALVGAGGAHLAVDAAGRY
jgi:hypothetical protein